MLPRRYRISFREFIQNKNFAKKYYSPKLSVFVKQNGLDLSRFSILVSKKTDKRSTVRNRIKRKVSDLILKNTGFVIGSYDILIRITKSPEEAGKFQNNEIVDLFKKAGILKI